MIIRKTEENNIIEALYSSSTICASKFNRLTNELTIIFNSGGQYKYPNIDTVDYQLFEGAESNGSVFTSVIRKKYSNFVKMDKVNVGPILTEVDKIKNGII